MKEKVTYHALINLERSPGIGKKIYSTLDACRHLGLQADAKIHANSISGIIGFVFGLLRENSKFIYIRFSDWVFPLIFFLVLYHRAMGRKIIADVPTPRAVGLKEIDVSAASPHVKLIRKLWNLSSGGWVLWPFSKVVQYAEESAWFSFGVKHKTLKIGNGIAFGSDTSLAGCDRREDEFNLIAVAQMADWHGYDRLIKALFLLHEKKLDTKVHLTLVGNGTALSGLRALAERLGLQGQVTFTGMLTGDQLDQAFSTADIGVASLGLYRKGLHEASDLKSREYMSRGLCVMGVGSDPDFPPDSPYRFLVPNDDSIEPVAEAITELATKALPLAQEVIDFAQNNLNWKIKVRKVLGIVDDSCSAFNND